MKQKDQLLLLANKIYKFLKLDILNIYMRQIFDKEIQRAESGFGVWVVAKPQENTYEGFTTQEISEAYQNMAMGEFDKLFIAVKEEIKYPPILFEQEGKYLSMLEMLVSLEQFKKSQVYGASLHSYIISETKNPHIQLGIPIVEKILVRNPHANNNTIAPQLQKFYESFNWQTQLFKHRDFSILQNSDAKLEH